MVRTWFTRSTSFCNLSYIFNPSVWFEKVSSSQILWYFFISPHFFTSYLQFNINKSNPKHNTKETLERCLQTFFSNTDIDYVRFQVDPNTEQYRAGM